AANIGRRDWEFGPWAFRPMSARSILSRRSADGKDRALLLCLLAGEYGLEAWPVLARLRDRRLPPDEASSLALPLLDHFNHSLVMVGTEDGKPLLLDASNPYRPPAVMPSQLSGSFGMVIFPDSARPVEIPDLGAAACLWEEKADVTVDEDGGVLWEEEIVASGAAAEALRFNFQNPDTRDHAWESFLSSRAGVPGAVWSEFSEDPRTPASASFSGRARLGRLASLLDGRAILKTPPLPGFGAPGSGGPSFPLSLDDMAIRGLRRHDLSLPYGFRITRDIRVRYPDGWRLVNPAPSFRREYAFGSVSLSSESSPGVLAVKFDVNNPSRLLAAGDFPDFREMAALAKRWLNPILAWETP
ncbi:MAG: hypothetical protein LBU23_13170, partial [Planctomycetota bacterium]|nr:hypothetical protein [Planctomycetota bacterium]